jgi:hypothetical protein
MQTLVLKKCSDITGHGKGRIHKGGIEKGRKPQT